MGYTRSCRACYYDLGNVIGLEHRPDDTRDAAAHDAVRTWVFWVHWRVGDRLPRGLAVAGLPSISPLRIARTAKAEGARLVVCGHSHVPFIGSDKGVTVFNPGSIGPRRFTLPIVLGTIDVSAAGFKLAHIDAATGQTWLPP